MGKPRERINMTKNMTRKSLALGAAAALVVTGFSAMPANAAGLADTSFVSLAPTTGTEYGVIAADGNTFSMTSNEASTVSTGNLKFLVTDPSGVVLPGATTTGGDSDAIATSDWVSSVAAINAVTFTTSGVTNGQYRMWVDADLTLNGAGGVVLAKDTMVQVSVNDNLALFISPTGFTTTNASAFAATANVYFSVGQSVQDEDAIAGDSSEITGTAAAGAAGVGTATLVTSGVANGTYVVYSQSVFIINDGGASPINFMAAGVPQVATVTNNAVTLVTAVETIGGEDTVVAIETLIFIDQASLSTVIRNTTANTYVVDSGVSNPATSEVLELVVDGTTSRSVTVQAFMDVNTNGALDSTEYASPARTVTWTKPSELVTGVSMTPISGDLELNAVVSTTPVLNGEQQNAQDATWLNVAFTRQNSVAVEYSQDEETGTSTSIWDNTAKTFTVDVSMDADASNTSSLVAGSGGDTVDGWSQLAAPTAINAITGTTVSVLSNVATVTVNAAHALLVGDKVTFEDETGANDLIQNIQFTVTGVPTTTTFTMALTAADGALAGTTTDQEYNVTTYAGNLSLADAVFAGTYTAQVYVEAVASGSLLSVGTIAAATASATLATTGSASVTGNTVTADTANDQTIKVGTATVPLTLTALSSTGVALGAGRTVVVTTEAPIDGGATSGTFKVNGAASATLTTDANGQVTFNVTTNNTTASAQTRVSALVENAVTVGMDLHWDAQAYTLVDYGTTAGTIGTNAAIARTILVGGSYSLNLAVEDQWFQAAAADTYRVVVSGSGVTEGIQSLVAGKAVVAVRDAGLTAVNGNFTSSVVLQKLTGGVWAAASTHTVTTTLKAAPTVNLGADGSTTYAPGGNASDLSDLVAAKALVEIDQRSSTTATPAYANAVTVQGNTVDGVTSAAVANVYVTISGPSNILFSNDKLAARGSLTLLTDANGEFEVNLYSTSAQTNTVITVTGMGVSKTTKVSFTGVGVGEGTSLVITAPAAVKPATTFQVSAKLHGRIWQRS